MESYFTPGASNTTLTIHETDKPPAMLSTHRYPVVGNPIGGGAIEYVTDFLSLGNYYTTGFSPNLTPDTSISDTGSYAYECCGIMNYDNETLDHSATDIAISKYCRPELDENGTIASGELMGYTSGAIATRDPAPYWCQGIGYRILDEATLQIGNQNIDKLYSTFLYMYSELSQAPQKGNPGAHWDA